MRRDFSKALAWLWRTWLGVEGVYRPELHYMRGPGPARRARYGYFARDLWPRSTVQGQKVLPPSSKSP
jgi:hypothetical protein